MGTFNVFRGISDEDKYAGLTKTQWIIIGSGILLCMPILRLTSSIGKMVFIFGIIFSVIIMIAFGIIALFPIPQEKYLYGGGYRMEIILFRILMRKIKKNRVIYVKELLDEGEVN